MWQLYWLEVHLSASLIGKPVEPRRGLTEDFVSQYINALQRELGVTVNDSVLRAAEGS